jgi:hypothetical protein
VRIRKCIAQGKWLVAVLVLPLVCAGLADQQTGVRMQGIYRYVVRPDNPVPVFAAEYNFDVLVSGCSWIIAYEDTSALTNAELLNVRATASCDGTNIYFVQYQSESAVKKAWGNRYDSVKAQLPTIIAKIFPGVYPPPEEFTLQTIWFALAADCVLGPASGRIKPIESVDLAMFYGNTNVYCGYYRTTDQNKPGTHQITLTNDGYFAVRDNRDGKVLRLKGAPPYDKGFVQGIGIWSGTTNVGAVRVSREFEFTAFAPRFGRRDSAEFERTFSFRCIVTNVGPATVGEIPVPLPNGRVLVADRRLANEGWARIDYMATNGWMAVNDDFIAFRAQNSPKSSFESEVLAVLNHPRSEFKWFRYATWLLLVLPLGLWALGAFRQKYKQRKA